MSASWKAFELRIGRLFGVGRRGPTGRNRSDLADDACHYSVECKLIARPNYHDLLKAAKQAERNALPGQEPIAIVKRLYLDDNEALVVMTLQTFKAWRL